MPHFMREHVHVARRAVEAGEYERSFIIGQGGHISRRGLIRLIIEIHELVFEHKIDKFARLFAHFVIHRFCLFYEIGTITYGNGVSVLKEEFFVIASDFIHADSLRLRFI